MISTTAKILRSALDKTRTSATTPSHFCSRVISHAEIDAYSTRMCKLCVKEYDGAVSQLLANKFGHRNPKTRSFNDRRCPPTGRNVLELFFPVRDAGGGRSRRVHPILVKRSSLTRRSAIDSCQYVHDARLLDRLAPPSILEARQRFQEVWCTFLSMRSRVWRRS